MKANFISMKNGNMSDKAKKRSNFKIDELFLRVGLNVLTCSR